MVGCRLRAGVRCGPPDPLWVATGRAQPEPKHRFGRWRRPATGCGAGVSNNRRCRTKKFRLACRTTGQGRCRTTGRGTGRGKCRTTGQGKCRTTGRGRCRTTGQGRCRTTGQGKCRTTGQGRCRTTVPHARSVSGNPMSASLPAEGEGMGPVSGMSNGGRHGCRRAGLRHSPAGASASLALCTKGSGRLNRADR